VNPRRVWQILRKDLELGPRSPVFLWTLVMPVVATILLQLVFGGLFAPQPRLAIVDFGSSEVTAAYQRMEGIEVTLLESEERLMAEVEANDYDAGLILSAGFDDDVRQGRMPALQFFLSGESLASDRIILALTTIDLVRALDGAAPPVEVEVVQVGAGAGLPISARLVPLVVIFALLIAGVFLPGTSLVEEKELKTLSAILVTPVKLSEVLAAKAVLGGALALLMSVVTLALNRALGSDPLALVLALLVAAAMCVEIGLLYGAAAKDMKALTALFKGLNIFLFAPVIFYLFPDWPRWPAMMLPTYWVIDPVFEVAVNGSGLAGVWFELVIATAICIVLAVVIGAAVRRMQRQVATG
jgi:ABC-2 type transport system permease protein